MVPESSIVLHFLPALDPLPVSENLEDALSILERTQKRMFWKPVILGSQQPSFVEPKLKVSETSFIGAF